MANDVYRYTHAALSALVSPRVAHHILATALAAKGLDPDSVTTGVMRHVLAGPVRQELSHSLPRAGLTSTLRRLADELAGRSEHPDQLPTPVTDALIAESDAERAIATLTSERLAAAASSSPLASEQLTAPLAAALAEPAHEAPHGDPLEGAATSPASPAAAPFLPAPFQPAAAPGRLPGRSVAGAAERGTARRAQSAAPHKVISRLDDAATVAALKLFGDIETVRQVVVVRRLEVVLQRGHGIDAAALPGLVLSTRHLLARSGDLRALSVERAGGVLFLFPFGEDCVVVVTLPHVNIGAVLNARAALEEAA